MMRCTILLFGLFFFSINVTAQTEKQNERFAKQIFKDFKKGNLDLIQDQFMTEAVFVKMIVTLDGNNDKDIGDRNLKKLNRELQSAKAKLGHSLKKIREELSGKVRLEKAVYLKSEMIKQAQLQAESISLYEMRIFFKVKQARYSLWFDMNFYYEESKQFYLLTDNLKLLKDDKIEWFYGRIDNASAMEELRNELNPVMVDERTDLDAPVIYDKGVPEPSIKPRLESKSNQNTIYTAVEQVAEFPGGEDKLFEWLDKNVVFPTVAKDNGISGIVYIEFIINQDGSHSDYKVLRDIGGGCGEAAMQALKKMPKWKPAKNNGQTVRSFFTLPVMFETDE